MERNYQIWITNFIYILFIGHTHFYALYCLNTVHLRNIILIQHHNKNKSQVESSIPAKDEIANLPLI